MADQSGEPPNSHLPVDPFRGDLVEYLVGNRGHDQPADHCDCRPYPIAPSDEPADHTLRRPVVVACHGGGSRRQSSRRLRGLRPGPIQGRDGPADCPTSALRFVYPPVSGRRGHHDGYEGARRGKWRGRCRTAALRARRSAGAGRRRRRRPGDCGNCPRPRGRGRLDDGVFVDRHA